MSDPHTRPKRDTFEFDAKHGCNLLLVRERIERWLKKGRVRVTVELLNRKGAKHGK